MKYLILLTFLLTSCAEEDFMKTNKMECSFYLGSGNRMTVCETNTAICFHWNESLSCIRK